MKENISIHIPTPCHENWAEMTSADKGRFCQSCAKTVVDFSLMTDNEVLNYFSKATGNTCGRFASSQLQRPLQPLKEEKKKAWWIAAMLPLLLFFKKGEAQNKAAKDSVNNVIKLEEQVMGLGDVVVVQNKVSTDYWHVDDDGDYTPPDYKPLPKKQAFAATITVSKSVGDSVYHISGKVIGKPDNYPVSFATVMVKGTKTATATDAEGNFALNTNIQGKETILLVSCVGYTEAEVLVRLKDSIAPKNKEYRINGVVLSEKTKQPVSFCTITAKGTSMGTTADLNGAYAIKFAAKNSQPVLIISSVGYKDKEIPVPAGNNSSIVAVDTVFLTEDTTALAGIDVIAGYVVCAKKIKKQDAVTSGVKKVFSVNKFKTYPNPVPRGGNITIEIKNEGVYVTQLFDNEGHLINAKEMEATTGGMQAIMNIPSQLNGGTYYIRLIDEKKKKEYTDKIVVM